METRNIQKAMRGSVTRETAHANTTHEKAAPKGGPMGGATGVGERRDGVPECGPDQAASSMICACASSTPVDASVEAGATCVLTRASTGGTAMRGIVRQP
jgi:hypothetical protein